MRFRPTYLPRQRAVASTLLALGLLAAAPAASAASAWPSRLFMIAPAQNPQPGGDRIQDFLETPGGGILIASGSPDSAEGLVRELTLSGQLRTIAHFPQGSGRSGIGLLAAPGGGFLAVDGWADRVLRVSPSGASETLAGIGTAGLSGDGGPALGAELDIGATDLAGLASLSDGSIVFADSWNNRLRRIRPDGVIETIAGAGATMHSGCAPIAGDGGPATQATLCSPSDVLATADGGLLFTDTGHQVIRRIAPNGTIATVAGSGSPVGSTPGDEGKPATEVPLEFPQGLAQLPDGDILVAEFGRIGRLSHGRYHTLLRFGPSLLGSSDLQMPMLDFTGRRVDAPVTGLAVTAEGGVLIAAGSAYYLAPRRSRRTLVAIRDARVSRRKVALSIQATRSGTATVEVRRHAHTVARARSTVRAGRRLLQVAGSFASHPHTVRVTLRRSHAVVARDAVDLYLDDRLPMTYAKRIAKRQEDEAPLDGCRRFSARRVDCSYAGDLSCEPVTALTLRRSGVIWFRRYACVDAQRPYRRHPSWLGPAWPLGAPDW